MNKSIILGLVASVALVACGSKEEVAAPAPEAEAPAVEVTTPVEGEVPADAQTVVGEVSSSEPAKEPTVVYPAETPAQ